MKTLKGGCILVDAKNKTVALVYRDYLNDYTFPKGHLEKGESIRECAIRETAEETKRIAIVLDEFKPIINRYTTKKGEKCECYLYISLDGGHSDNTSTDTHKTIWVPINEVEEKLTYDNLKIEWNIAKKLINKII